MDAEASEMVCYAYVLVYSSNNKPSLFVYTYIV